MSAYLYDEAITTALRTTSNDGRVSIIPFEKAFNKAGAINDDVTLPLVTLNRSGYSMTKITKSHTGAMDGWYVREKDEEGNLISFRIRYLPMTINYTLDIITVTRQQNDELTRELIWFFQLHPAFKAKVSYSNFYWNLEFHAFLGEDVTDNSEILEFENRGQYYRSTLDLVVDEAQLLLVDPTPDAVTVEFKLISVDIATGKEEIE